MTIRDCLCFDGGYVNHVNNVIEKYNEKGYGYSLDNFTFPIRKKKNVEKEYNPPTPLKSSTIKQYEKKKSKPTCITIK